MRLDYFYISTRLFQQQPLSRGIIFACNVHFYYVLRTLPSKVTPVNTSTKIYITPTAANITTEYELQQISSARTKSITQLSRRTFILNEMILQVLCQMQLQQCANTLQFATETCILEYRRHPLYKLSFEMTPIVNNYETHFEMHEL